MQSFSALTDMFESVRAAKADQAALPYDIRGEIDWVDFSSTANPLGVPEIISDALCKAIKEGDLNYLPNREGSELISILARYYEIPEECFLAGTSNHSLIACISSAYKPCNVGVPVPAPAEYFLRAANVGHNPIKLINPFSLAAIEPQMAKNNGLRFEAAILANPSFPCARLLSESTLDHYLDCCNWVIIDESSISLTMGGESFIPLTQKKKNLIVVRSISNEIGMCGVPMGYAVAHPDTMNFIRQFNDGSTIGMFHEIVAKQLPELEEYTQQTNELLDSEIPWMQCMLSLTPGIKVFPSEANFVMCRLEERATRDFGIMDAADLVVRLQKSGYTVRDLTGVPGIEGKKFFSVSIRSHKENEEFIVNLRKLINEAADGQ